MVTYPLYDDDLDAMRKNLWIAEATLKALTKEIEGASTMDETERLSYIDSLATAAADYVKKSLDQADQIEIRGCKKAGKAV